MQDIENMFIRDEVLNVLGRRMTSFKNYMLPIELEFEDFTEYM